MKRSERFINVAIIVTFLIVLALSGLTVYSLIKRYREYNALKVTEPIEVISVEGNLLTYKLEYCLDETRPVRMQRSLTYSAIDYTPIPSGLKAGCHTDIFTVELPSYKPRTTQLHIFFTITPIEFYAIYSSEEFSLE